jgi:Cu2+-exporting ATPase
MGGVGLQFCCAGCRAVYETVQSCGLGTYYKLRDAAALTPAKPGQSRFDAFDSEAFGNLYVGEQADGRRSADLFLEGVTCGACIWLVEKLPAVLEGVVEARLSLRRSTVRVTWDPARVRLSQVARTLDGFGYAPHPAKGASRETMYRKELRDRLVKLGVAGALMGNLMLLAAAMYAGWVGAMDGSIALMLRWISLGLGVTALAWPGAEFFRSSLAAIRTRTVNLDVPITLALAAGGVAGVVNVLVGRGEIYFDSLSALVFLLLIGRFLQFRHQRRSHDAVELLFSMTPATCWVIGAYGEPTETPIEALAIGDVVEVRSGDLVPADGVVVSGSSTVDQALLTGESVPVAVSVGSEVFGSSQNGASALGVRVSRVGEATRVGQLMRLLDRGLAEKPDIVRFGDRVGRWFVVAVSLAAVGTFAYWMRVSTSAAVDNAVAMLIVTCPCVLGLATPMTLSVAIGQLARRDVLVKSGGALEKLARGGRMMLDKTGTLTEGRMRVAEYSGDGKLRGAIARLERSSNHAVARAMVVAFEGCEPPAELRGAMTDVSETNGGIRGRIGERELLVGSPAYVARAGVDCAGVSLGLEGEGTVVMVALDGLVRARVLLRDRLREGTARAVDELRGLRFRPEVWSGDAEPVVSAVARQLGIRGARGGVCPEGKLAAVRSVPQTIMVGDGVNDAAALAAATVGIAVHGGSEASLAAADVYIARPGLAPVVDLVRTARRTMRVIRGNFCVSLGYNLVAGALAATGHMNPLIAAILMPLSSASVLTLAVALMSGSKKESR